MTCVLTAGVSGVGGVVTGRTGVLTGVVTGVLTGGVGILTGIVTGGAGVLTDVVTGTVTGVDSTYNHAPLTVIQINQYIIVDMSSDVAFWRYY